ncbi:unnamed protein product [Paramecium pentaurelia]|uniref:Mini antigen n=1 Tax=Paramecium pentaurelia TaxID=43138 RepID=A0A8S1XAG1_9CILI|nr:unnamed protein product [Paramecium pentaurelia]
MKILLITLSLLALVTSTTTVPVSSVYQCSCTNAMTQTDCLTDYCNWDSTSGTCSNKACTVFSKEDCEGVPDTFGCIWNYTSNKCEGFTKCSDYTFTIGNAGDCNDKLIKCQADLNTIDSTTGTIKCKNRTQDAILSIDDCNLLPYANCFWYLTPDGKQCLQNTTTNKCEAKSITKCSDYTKDNCNILACYLNGDVCTELTCAIIPEDQCFVYFSYDSKSMIFCSWNGSACVDLNVSTLTQEKCLDSTYFTYGWNPDSKQCEICVTDPDQDSSTNIILYGSILMAIVFLS